MTITNSIAVDRRLRCALCEQVKADRSNPNIIVNYRKAAIGELAQQPPARRATSRRKRLNALIDADFGRGVAAVNGALTTASFMQRRPLTPAAI